MEKAISISYNERFSENCRYAASAGFSAIAIDYCSVGSGKRDSYWGAVTEDIIKTLEDTGLHFGHANQTSRAEHASLITALCLKLLFPTTMLA